MQAGVPFAASHSHAACGQRHTHTCHGGDAIYQWQFPQGARAITSPRNLPSAHSVLGNGMVKDATLCFAQARALLPQILQRSGATIRLVTSTLSNVGRFSNCTGLQPAQVLTVHSRDAFPRSFEEHRDAWRGFRYGDVVIVAAGPVGRLLAIEWHTKQPRVTYLELGSFFDPDLTDTTFFGRGHGALEGARYYPQTQCGRLVDQTVYRPKMAFSACQRPGDVRATIDVSAIWHALRPSLLGRKS